MELPIIEKLFRQTGRTSRMLQAAVNKAEETNKSVLVVISNKMQSVQIESMLNQCKYDPEKTERTKELINVVRSTGDDAVLLSTWSDRVFMDHEVFELRAKNVFKEWCKYIDLEATKTRIENPLPSLEG